MVQHTPRGFRVHTASAGLSDDGRDDLTIVVSETPAVACAMFTKSRFAGPSVVLSREAVADFSARGFVVLARNANVATGKLGMENAVEVRRRVAQAVGLSDQELLIAATGVIGVQFPMDSVRAALDELQWPFDGNDFDAAAHSIMTTDTKAKVISLKCGDASLVGIAKGVGMLEPNMATMLTFFCTDADIPQPELDRVFRSVIARTFNAVSIDTDTSTSDTAAIFANGQAGPVDVDEFERVLYDAALRLVREIARDGEGATKLIEVHVSGARDDDQAKRVGKTVVNSPLVKTAVHGSDPNWGRVAMAIGKCQDDLDIVPERVRIGFGDLDVYPDLPDEDAMARLVEHLEGDTVQINIDLGIADGGFTVYGCDLTEGYVRLNSEYTT
ncbi:bifunctional glutamate N-acetyltransferase/amino-acid acetyltransferase ArgJ [Kibdelosporangium philippinense]|uniref:Arginine biosynthesis bifunctional protein ArgJ n=1 Tax=Kibdelosporangium philippinense TaxID=211113 RepID=A0ABS8ZK52_9PSEU|nr:bifunctional glutamate N-acetyltransferase/amino-acid acetyltransferase ArgJ [Kibdelosporangium philippinense]MCE7008174.1 bifunctional glutamate N-acetyltransferase/amino-acid acetyltransferase ArgJ [Kibdelosporangium philippinense]